MLDDVDGTENNLRKNHVTSPPMWQTRLDGMHRRWKELEIKMSNRENTIQDKLAQGPLQST